MTVCGTAKGTDAGYQRHRKAGEAACDECRTAHNAKTRADKASAYARHPAKVAAQNERWRRANRSTSNAASRRRYAANPDKYREDCRLWYAENRELVLAKNRRWIEANRERVRERVRRRHALKASAVLAYFSEEQLAARMAYWGNQCWMCNGEYESVDHVKPLAAGGPHCLSNLRPACRSCNASKNARWAGVNALTDFLKVA